MENRRHILQLSAFAAVLGSPLAGGTARLGNLVIDPKQAKLTRKSFGDLRVFFEGPTAQLKSMTAGSLILNPGQEPHPPHHHLRRSS
jgi:hypothetical protein